MKAVAIVTGASRGIGREIAVQLASDGFRVAATARTESHLATLRDTVDSEQTECHILAGDLTDDDFRQTFIDSVLNRWGQIDVLVNNAGVMYPANVTDASTDSWDAMIDLNFSSLTSLTKLALPAIREQNGHIVNISSVAGRVTKEGYSIYSGTKHAVNAFSEGLRKELSDEGIRVSVVEPGIVQTELYSTLPDSKFKRSADDWFEDNRPLEPANIAETVLFIINQPDHINIDEILIRPVDQRR